MLGKMQQAGRNIGAYQTVKGVGGQFNRQVVEGCCPVVGELNTRRVLRGRWVQLSHFADGKTEAQSGEEACQSTP